MGLMVFAFEPRSYSLRIVLGFLGGGHNYLFLPVLECQARHSALMNNERLTFCYCYLPLVTSQTVKGVYLHSPPLQMLDIKMHNVFVYENEKPACLECLG